MGGIQPKEGSLAEVHAVRGGQLILRVAQSQTALGANGVQASANKLHRQQSLNLMLVPYNGHCYILDQSMDVLEKILLRLSPRELALLSLTCRAMHLIVGQFLRRVCSAYDLRSKVRAFYDANADLLLPKEVVLRDRLDTNSRHELLLYSARNQFFGEVRRVSFCRIDQFDHFKSDDGKSTSLVADVEEDSAGLAPQQQNYHVHVPLHHPHHGQQQHVVREREVSLKRDVIIQKRVSWLRFRHSFHRVPAGTYLVQIRLRLSYACWESVQPVHNASAFLKVTRKSSKLPKAASVDLVSQRIEPSWWMQVETEHHDHMCTTFDLAHAQVIFDRDSDWFFLRLRSFQLDDALSDIEVELDDTSNPNWKQGVIWDFVELRLLAPRRRVKSSMS